MNNFGARLAFERKRLGFSRQEDFAAIGGVKKRAQANYEGGSRFPDASYLQKITEAGADIQYLITGVRGAGESRKYSECDIETGFKQFLKDNLFTGWVKVIKPEFYDMVVRFLIFHVKKAAGENVEFVQDIDKTAGAMDDKNSA